jgi:hypothetical protein
MKFTKIKIFKRLQQTKRSSIIRNRQNNKKKTTIRTENSKFSPPKSPQEQPINTTIKLITGNKAINHTVRRFLILGATGKNPQNSQNSHLKKAPKHQIFSQGAFAGWRGLGFLAARTGIKPRF